MRFRPKLVATLTLWKAILKVVLRKLWGGEDPATTAFTPYRLLDADHTHCSACGNEPLLLCPTHDPNLRFPAFYVCWHCHKVAQVGVGKVPYTPDPDDA